MQVEPECVDDLHERAADWYEKNGFAQEAVEHAFQVSNIGKASRLIGKHALPMLYQGEVSIVAGWLDRLWKPLLQSSPMMCICRAWALALPQRQMRMEQVEGALQAADDALNLANADETLRNLIAGHAASIRVYLMQSPPLANEEPEKLIETSEKAQRLLPQDEHVICSVNALNIGYESLFH